MTVKLLASLDTASSFIMRYLDMTGIVQEEERT